MLAHDARNAHLHPSFAAIVNSFASDALRLAAYRRRLEGFRWDFEHFDDSRAHQHAKDTFEELRREAAVIDPTFAVWDSIAPPCAQGGCYPMGCL